MYELYNASRGLSGIVIISSLLCLAYIIAAFKRDVIPFVSKMIAGYFDVSAIIFEALAILFSLLFCVLSLSNSSFFAVKIADSKDIRVYPDGTYCYYVEATNENGKTYTLPACVYKTDGEYAIGNVYFSNGGYLDFRSTYSREFGETIGDYDRQDRYWELKLTNLKASHPDVEETEVKAEANDYLCFAFAILQFINAILHILSFAHEQKETKNG